MAVNTTKDKVLEAIEKLPPNATIEDVMERLFFLAKVERGIEDAEAGKTILHEEAKRRLTR
jgi:predicted transcriptional regulator